MSHVKAGHEDQGGKGNEYRGYRTPEGCVVYVGNIQLPQTATAKQHSPLGFEWGYGGSGPHALANAILAYELAEALGAEGAEQVADDLGSAFRSEVIAGLPRITSGPDDVPQWYLSGATIRDWVIDHVKRVYDGKLENVHPAWHVWELDEIWNQ